MNPFTKFHIKNFQSIKDAEFELGPVNVVCGASNIGKSACVRAVKTLLRNSYDNSYMRSGCTNLEVSAEDGTNTAVFSRNGNKSGYTLNGKSYSRIGKSVPKEVEEWFNTSPASVSDTSGAKDIELDVNIQNQFDTPFLISNPGFDNARIFGQLTDIESCVTAQTVLVKDIKTISAEIDRETKTQDELQAWIEENKSVLELKTKLDKIHELYEKIEHLSAITSKIEELEEQRKRVLSRKSELEYKIKKLNALLERFDPQEIHQLSSLEQQAEKAVPDESYLKHAVPLNERLVSCLRDTDNVSQDAQIVLTAVSLADTSLSIEKQKERLTALKASSQSYLQNAEKLEELRGKILHLKQEAMQIQTLTVQRESNQTAIVHLEDSLKGHALCPITGRTISQECFTNA